MAPCLKATSSFALPHESEFDYACRRPLTRLSQFVPHKLEKRLGILIECPLGFLAYRWILSHGLQPRSMGCRENTTWSPMGRPVSAPTHAHSIRSATAGSSLAARIARAAVPTASSMRSVTALAATSA